MMRKSLWLLALLLVVSGSRLAKADTTENVTFGYNGGSLTGTETLVNGQLTSIKIDGYNLNLIGGWSNSLLQGCQSSGCSWNLFSVLGTVDLEVSNGGIWELASCIFCSNSSGLIQGGGTYGPTSMPEPPVYLLALLGIVFTRNRISQGLRQALRWSH
jgi:hypothetical protein